MAEYRLFHRILARKHPHGVQQGSPVGVKGFFDELTTLAPPWGGG